MPPSHQLDFRHPTTFVITKKNACGVCVCVCDVTKECCLRAFAERGRFLCNAWNIMDVITVILGWTSMASRTKADGSVGIAAKRSGFSRHISGAQ